MRYTSRQRASYGGDSGRNNPIAFINRIICNTSVGDWVWMGENIVELGRNNAAKKQGDSRNESARGEHWTEFDQLEQVRKSS
jgi:hypothetical protein